MFNIIPFETKRNRIKKKLVIFYLLKMSKRASAVSRISIKVGPDVPLESAYPVSMISFFFIRLTIIIYIVRADETRC
jgi:hypothetical protein